MARLLQPLISIALGALGGVVVVSLALYSELSRASFASLPFALLGTALVATGHGMLVGRGFARWFAYVIAPPAGAVVGAIWLGAMAGLDGANARLGAQYGFACALAWAIADLAVSRSRKLGLRAK